MICVEPSEPNCLDGLLSCCHLLLPLGGICLSAEQYNYNMFGGASQLVMTLSDRQTQDTTFLSCTSPFSSFGWLPTTLCTCTQEHNSIEMCGCWSTYALPRHPDGG